MTNRIHSKIDLEVVLAEALRALAVLDADALEGLAEFLEASSETLDLPRSVVEWKRLRSRQWVLGHLLEGTRRRLQMLRRVSSTPDRLGSYGGPGLGRISSDRAMRFPSPDASSKRESSRSHRGGQGLELKQANQSRQE